MIAISTYSSSLVGVDLKFISNFMSGTTTFKNRFNFCQIYRFFAHFESITCMICLFKNISKTKFLGLELVFIYNERAVESHGG